MARQIPPPATSNVGVALAGGGSHAVGHDRGPTSCMPQPRDYGGGPDSTGFDPSKSQATSHDWETTEAARTVNPMSNHADASAARASGRAKFPALSSSLGISPLHSRQRIGSTMIPRSRCGALPVLASRRQFRETKVGPGPMIGPGPVWGNRLSRIAQLITVEI